jgi:hypothetical protein
MTNVQPTHVGDGSPFESSSFSCRLCGEVIGVYEPLVACESSHTRTTSRAAEPGLQAQDGTYYHRTCFSEHNRATRLEG